MRSIVILQSLVSGLALLAQSDHCVRMNLLLNTAPAQTVRGEHIEAFNGYDSVFAHVPWGLWQRTEATSAALRQGDTIRAINYLEDTYRKGGEPLLTYSSEIKGLLALGFDQPELGRLLQAREVWLERADSTWIKALLGMEELDQAVRDGSEQMLLNDSINLERLIQLTEARGFPSPSIVGASYGIVHLLLWHHRGELGSNPSVMRYHGLVREAISTCAIEPDFMCGFIDYEDQEAGRPMCYGSLLYYYHSEGHVELVDRVQLNNNRASVGLGTIEDFALQMGLDLDALTRP